MDSVLTCCISSLPRWRLLRCVESTPQAYTDSAAITGVQTGMDSFLADRRLIISGMHPLVEELILASKDEYAIRVVIWNTILRSAMYISHKNKPFCSPFWGIPRWAACPSAIRQVVERPGNCCESTGGETKVRGGIIIFRRGSERSYDTEGGSLFEEGAPIVPSEGPGAKCQR